MATPQATGVDLLKTIAACIIAPVTAVVCAVIVGMIWFWMNSLVTVIRVEIIGFVASIIGAVAGMYAARGICDKFLDGYIPQAVFLVFLAIFLFLAYIYIFFYPFEWDRAGSYAQVAVMGFFSYVLFWKGDPLD